MKTNVKKLQRMGLQYRLRMVQNGDLLMWVIFPKPRFGIQHNVSMLGKILMVNIL